MKSSTRKSLFAALVLGALSPQLSGCGSENRVDDGDTSSTSAALAASRAAASGAGDSPTGAARPITGRQPLGNPAAVISDPCYPPPQVVSFSAAPAAIPLGGTATLSWDVEVPNGCPYTIALLGNSVAPQGRLDLQPILDTTYTLTLVWGPDRTLWTTASAGVTVILPADPLDSTRQLVTITEPPSIDLFLQGLHTPNTTVMVDNAVNLDLSGLAGIPIATGVRLVGGRAAAPGKPFQPGPRLFTTTVPERLFNVVGPRVRITGLRLQGRLNIDPPEIASDESSTAISLSSAASGAQIDHDEIFGWSNSGVEVLGDPNATASAVHPSAVMDGPSVVGLAYDATAEPAVVHDNYFHHNLHTSGLGYGVVVSANGHALIESNVFDWNRHAISDDGSDFSGYRAYRNLVLEHGGYNFWVPLGFWSYIQQFDVHGQNNCGVQSWFSDTQFNCGRAGNDVDIRYNSFSYTSAQAIKVRGTPQLAAFVDSNVFAADQLVDTVVTTGDLQTVIPGTVEWTETGVWLGAGNQVGVTWDATDACDFDGDGVPDRFLATGQTWWFSSNRGQGPWVYLNASTIRLNDLSLGYVDGDGLCDVTAGGIVYSGGTPAPDQRLGSLAVLSKGLLSR